MYIGTYLLFNYIILFDNFEIFRAKTLVEVASLA